MSYTSDFLIECFRNYSIYFLGILIILKFTGIPTGSSIVVIVAGAVSYKGEYNIINLLLQVWFFSCIGDLIGYISWKLIGYKVLFKFLTLKRFFEPKILKSQDYLDRYGKYLIFFSRFLISSTAPFVNAACGVSMYKFSSFSLYIIMGNFFWTIIYLSLGYWFSDSFEIIIPFVSSVGEGITFLTLAIIFIYVFVKRFKCKN